MESASTTIDSWNGKHESSVRYYSQPHAALSILAASQEAGEYWAPAITDELDISYTVSSYKLAHCNFGAGRFRQTSIAPGHFALRCLNEPISVQLLSPAAARSYGLPASLLARVMEEVRPGGKVNLDFGRLHTGFTQNSLVAAILEQIWQESTQPWLGSRLLIETSVVSLSLILLRQAQIAPLSVGRGGLSARQLTGVMEAMEAHLADDISLMMLAAVAGVSPTHFSRASKQSTGKPPFRWLLERRIQRAMELMRTSSLPLAQIALALGFAAQPQFSTAFLRVTGETPRRWRSSYA